MVPAEVLLGSSSRRDIFFAKKRGGGRRQPPSGRRPSVRQASPQPPDRNPFNSLTRRRLLIGSGVATLVGIGSIIADRLGIINLLPTSPDQSPQPETLEDMVAEAKRMEDSFKDKDLSNKTTRERYAGLLAGIYVINYPGNFTKEQILASMVWTDSTDDFVRERLKSSTKPALSEPKYRQEAPDTSASTDIRTKRMVVNTKANVYSQQNLDLLNSTYKWNPLKMLRISLFHEFGHLVETNSDNDLYSFVDPENTIRNRIIEGFRITGEDDLGYPTIFNNQHEAAIELFSKDLNERLFGSYYSNYINDQGQDIGIVMANLDQVIQGVEITKQEASSLHKRSKLKEFLILLMQKVGAKDTDPLADRLSVAFRLMDAIESGDQRIIQNFINLAVSIRKTPTK